MAGQNTEVFITRLSEILLHRKMRLCAAESCTGGWIGKACTDLAGSSAWFEGTLVTYSNAAKQSVLGVDASVLQQYGAVSEQTVCAMAQGALTKFSNADIAVAVSGVAGPEGGSEHNPVGTVWCAWQRRDKVSLARRFRFSGDRDAVRQATVQAAIFGLIELLEG